MFFAAPLPNEVPDQEPPTRPVSAARVRIAGERQNVVVLELTFEARKRRGSDFSEQVGTGVHSFALTPPAANRIARVLSDCIREYLG